MLSGKELKEWKEKQKELNLQLYRHQWHYALEEMGLKKQVDSVFSQLKDANLTVDDYQLDENNRKVYIPIKDGKIILDVYIITTRSGSEMARLRSDPFKPEAYEVGYEIESKDKEVEGKISKILDQQKNFKSELERFREGMEMAAIRHSLGDEF